MGPSCSAGAGQMRNPCPTLRHVPKKRRGPTPRAERNRVSKSEAAAGNHAGSGRYTAPTPAFRLRPRWHRWAGWLGVVAGIGIIVTNDAMFFVEGVTLLPGGHNELYLLLGLIVAGGFTWFLGLFDRGTTVFD